MSRLIVDVTQLYFWQGRLTGIPRVMFEYAQRFAREPDSPYGLAFVVWDGHRNVFRAVDIRGIAGRYTVETAAATVRGRAGSRAAELIFSAEQHSDLARNALAFARRSLRNYRTIKSLGQLEQLTLERGDVIFITWGEWGDVDLIAELQRLKAQGVGLVQFVHDMVPIIAPQYSGHSTQALSRYAKVIYPICDAVVANSQNTKRDVVEWLRQQVVPVPSVEVVRLGDDLAIAAPRRPSSDKFGATGATNGSYLLSVGTVEARKNHALLYYVYKLAMVRGIELPPLFIVGRRGWQAENTYELISKDPDLANRLVILSDVSDGELAWLYKHCKFTIYPSFYEGWGLPIAESVAAKKPCLSSSTSSMPEIAGDLIEYFSPFSVEECLAGIVRWLDPEKLEIANKKVTRYEPTAWDDSYAGLKAVIGRVVSAATSA
jgi:glycosyltransferase involved in cell wall biosynthesis